MKLLTSLAALLLAVTIATPASATCWTPETPQYPVCPGTTFVTPPTTTTVTSTPTQTASPSAAADAAASAAAQAAAAAKATGTAKATQQQASQAANSTSTSNVSRPVSINVAFPAPVKATDLPAVRCPSESEASASGWNFRSSATATTDAGKLCAASDVASWYISQCQYRTAQAVLNSAVAKAFPGVDASDLVIPADTKNLTAAECHKPQMVPVNVPVPTPTPIVPGPAPKTERVTLSAGALFDVDKSILKPEATQALDNLAAKLNAMHIERVVVIGHTDSTAGAAYNDALSLRRAEAVRTALVLRGVPPAVIAADGRGLREPIDTNATQDGRARNRRVTVEMTGLAR